eukprot:6054535-Prymnesium_polylepis.1
MGECVYQMGDDAKMLRVMTDPATCSQTFLADDWTVDSLLVAVAATEPTPHALIDTGALVTGFSNKQVYARPRLARTLPNLAHTRPNMAHTHTLIWCTSTLIWHTPALTWCKSTPIWQVAERLCELLPAEYEGVVYLEQ